MPHLVCVSGKLSGKEFPVRDRMRIGRLDTCELCVPHDDVSREHATLRSDGGRWTLQDLGSKNGTTINGARKKSADLKSGDRLTFGDMVFCFIDESDSGSASAVAGDSSGSAAAVEGERPSGESGEAAAPSSGSAEAVEGDRPSDESGEAVAVSAAARRPGAASRGFGFEAGLDASQRTMLENVLFGFVWLLVFFCASIATQVLLRMIAV